MSPPHSSDWGGRGERMRELEAENLDLRIQLQREKEAAQRAIDGLEVEREFLAAIVHRAPVGFAISAAPDGRPILLNDKARELLSPGRLTGDLGRYDTYGAVHPDGKPYAVEDYPTVRALLHGEVIDREEMFYCAGHADACEGAGSSAGRRLEVSSTPVRDEGGTIVAAVTVFVDVEKQRRAEEALRELVGTLDLAAIMVRDLRGTIRFWSKGCERLYGWTAEEAIGRASQDLLRTGFPVPPEEIEATLLRDGEWRGDLRHARRNGTSLVVAAHKALRRDANGRPATVLESLADVTEVRFAEAAAARLAAIVASSDDAIISFAPEDGRIMTWNRGAERLFGYTEAEAVGSHVGLLVPADLPEDEPTGVFAWAMEGRPVVAHETVRVSKGGEHVPVAITATRMVTSDGRVFGVSGIFHDLRPRIVAEAALRESEAQLLQAQKLEAIGRLAAGVAHDFNNILQAVAGGLELILDDLPDDAPVREYAEIAYNSARRGSSLTHHLLSYARKQVLLPKLLDVGPVLTEMRGVLGRTLGPLVDVEIGVDPAALPVRVDPGQLETALLNLAINARDAMPGGGALRFAVRRQREGEKPYTVVSVADTGTGMDEATLARAFDPFFTTKGTEGSGLGLSMIQGFAKQSGGEVRIRSAPAAGTTVELWLPASRWPAGEQRPRDGGNRGSGRCPSRSGRILLVEDAADVLVTTRAFLERAGCYVIQAESAGQALAALATNEHFDALVTDYALPGVDGVSLIRQARGIQPGLPAVLITGLAEVEGVDTLPEAVAILRKPFERSALLEAVQRIMA